MIDPRLNAVRELGTQLDGARLVVIFGSVTQGTAAPWSDVDVGVSGVEFWRGLEIGTAIGRHLGREAHVVELEAASDWLRYRVALDGFLVREAEPGVWARFQAGAALRWFDLQPIVARCAEGARRHLLQGTGRG